MSVMVNDKSKIISYEINEAKIRKLVVSSGINSLLDYNAKVIHSTILNNTYILWILTPQKNVERVSEETIYEIKKLIHLLHELCRPIGHNIKLTELMADFLYACGGHKFLNEDQVIKVCRPYAMKIQEYPEDVIEEAFNNYIINYSGFPSINMVIEMMERLYAKRRSLYDSLQKIIINLEKNEGGEFAFT
jgi:hypothetical protein